MAKKASKSGGKSAGAKSKPAKAKGGQAKRAVRAAPSARRPSSDMSATDALTKLIESPLVADLLAVGATAALAAIAGHRATRPEGSGGAVKAAGKAAAAAMGRRLSTEVTEIRNASKAKDGPAD
jgi:hypothetical protein